MELLHGRYEKLKELGKGGSGQVFQVYDHRLQQYFASKRVKLDEKEDKECFYRELSILTTLHHPHIPRVIDQFEENHYAYVIMDQIDGTSLIEYIVQKREINEMMLLQWMLEIIEIFLYLHHLMPTPLLYLDLKPQNIMLAKDKSLYLIDFGSSTMSHEHKPVSATIGYASEELVKHHQANKQCDIYSFGVTFYVLAHGHFPKDVKAKSSLDRVLLTCCAKEVNKRYNNFEEVQTQVQRLCLQRSHHLYKGIVFLCLSVLCIWLACFIRNRNMDIKDINYLHAMKQENYVEAMRWKSDAIEPYERYYEAHCTQKDTCEKAFLELKEQAIAHKQNKKSNMAFFLACKAMQQQQKIYFQMAEEYLKDVEGKNTKEKQAISNLRYMVKVLSSKDHQESEQEHLLQALQQVETYSASLKDIKERYLYETMLVMVYDVQQRTQPYASEALIRLCNQMKLQVDASFNELDLTQHSYLNERLAYGYYYKGLQAYMKQDYLQMKKDYEAAITYFIEIKKKENSSIMASMYLHIFEYAILDENKKESVWLLLKARDFATNIEQEKTRSYMLEMIQRKLINYESGN